MRPSPASDPCAQALDRWWQRCSGEPPAGPGIQPLMAVAYSGGADSTALLQTARTRWPTGVVALHIHHGLQAAADAFEAHARDTCLRWGVPLKVGRVNAAAAAGQSPEEAARAARYTALADLARDAGAGWVLLGQHADDQAETVMLALSRGAGLPGLSAMPERFQRHGMAFGRPFLGLTLKTLRDALQASGEGFVEDPTNSDIRFTRNRIRSRLLPAWDGCFPGFRPLLVRTAQHAAQAQALLDDLALIDLEHVGRPPALAGLQSLRRERQANALRYWLKQDGGAMPSTAQLDALLDQVAACTTRGHHIHLKVAGGFVTRAGAVLAYTPPI